MPLHTPDPSPSERADRREQVWQLRLAGNSYRQIAKEMGVSHVTIQHDITASLAERANRTQLSVDEHVTVVCAQLDKLMRTAVSEWESKREAAMLNGITNIIEKRCRILGLIKPGSLTVNNIVSIRAPARGATGYVKPFSVSLPFQSAPPHGGRTGGDISFGASSS